MQKKFYPLGHSKSEAKRLKTQAKLLSDFKLDTKLKVTKTCLEIGCGVGANVERVLKTNPKIQYIGIDISEKSIALARNKFKKFKNVKFEVMDATKLKFDKNSFELVFTKLVLWSVGKNWKKVVEEAHRVLKPKCEFHSFEPDDHLLIFYPEKPAISEVIRRWDKRTVSRRLDPFIGRKIASAMANIGFKDVKSEVFSKISLGISVDAYRSTAQNLQHIYMSSGPEYLGLKANSALWNKAESEFRQISPDDLIFEGYFVCSGTKLKKRSKKS